MYMCCLLASRSKDSVIDVDQVFDAIERDDIDAVKVAVAHGFDPASHQDESGELAFHLAASAGAIRVVRYFVEVLHMDVDVLHSDGSTPIIVAAWHGHKEVLDYLQSKGANLHARCYNGWNAVMGAVFWNEYEMLQYLADLKVDMDVPEKEGQWTPLKIAAAKVESRKSFIRVMAM
eukprot:m.143445 g.143445  ORF g.143445 m.143445 type:complete len:176 (-) comp16018_c0_seq5:532-1059(-)